MGYDGLLALLGPFPEATAERCLCCCCCCCCCGTSPVGPMGKERGLSPPPSSSSSCPPPPPPKTISSSSPSSPTFFFCLNAGFFLQKLFPFDYECLTGASSSIMVFAEGLLLPFPLPSSSKASSSSPSAAAASEANRTPSLDLPDPAEKDTFNFFIRKNNVILLI